MHSIFLRASLVAAAVLSAVFLSADPAQADEFKLDGVLSGASDSYSGSKEVSWYTGHKTDESIYGDADNPLGKTTIRWGCGTLAGDASGTEYFFVYVEAPLYAKNMIWQDIDWKGTYPVANTDPTVGLTEEDVKSYRVHHETHHDPGDMKLDFGGATGSEKMEVGGFKADLDGDADNDYGLLGYADVVDYLFANGLATESLSLNRNTPMSFEFMFAKDKNGATDNQDFLKLFDVKGEGLSFHLSPERGLPIGEPVPEPGTLALLGLGLAGLGLARRRRRKAIAS